MQNVSQESSTDNPKIDKVNVQHDIGTSSTPHSTSNSSPAKSETETYSEHRGYNSDSESEEDSVSEVESFMIDQDFEEDPAAKFLLNPDEDRAVDPETQARLEALLQAADEAAAALTRMRTDNPRTQPEKTSLVEACTDGDVRTVQKLLTEGGRSVHETSEEGESLLSLACSAGYFELAQVLLAMHANVEDRGIKGECTPLMEAASAGHLDIVRLLVAHGADVNAQSTTGNTPLMYGCAGGHTEVVQFLLEHGANVEDHNENGHTPLMEAASAGHVGLAKILLMHGAGINTHSNEFKESALTLACYKGHLDMVRFLLEAGADQEHKTDEMHTALMEASMDGHVEVARLLLDSGAQVNMPTDSFESPLTLAACGGHVDLAMLLIERGANIEEVNDEGYTPLMEAAREGHEEMVHLLLGQGANINAQTDETQETALTLACCGGFTDVADILLKGGANIELGASTPLMEAAQEGHLDLVKFLLQNGANVQAQTQTGDTALTYACENGHTDVADLLLQYGADLEHESEGGRTPLMKACRAGHLCTVQFLISKGANVRRQTTNNDHTPLSLACAGGHMNVVELLLAQNADPNHKLKDNSTMLIEAAKGGHTNVVQLLLDYPHSIQSMVLNQLQQGATSATNLSMLPGQIGSRDSPLPTGAITNNLPIQPVNFFQQPAAAVLQEVPEAVRIIPQDDVNNPSTDISKQQLAASNRTSDPLPVKNTSKKSILPKSRSTGTVFEGNLTSAEAQQVRTQPLPIDFEEDLFSSATAMEFLHKGDQNSTLIDFIKNRKKQYNANDDPNTQKQQILEELHKVERELHGKQHVQNHVFQYTPHEQSPIPAGNTLPHMLNLDIAMQQQQGLGSGMSGTMFPGHNLQVHNAFYTGSTACLQSPTLKLAVSSENGAYSNHQTQQPAFYFTPLSTSVAVSLSTATSSNANSQPIKFQSVTSHADVSQNTAISDRPKAKPVSKKEGKNVRKQQFQSNIYNQQSNQMFNPIQLQQTPQHVEKSMNIQDTLNVPGIDLDSLDQESLVLKEETHDNLITASILQQFHNSSMRAFGDSGNSRLEYFSPDQENKDPKLELIDKEYTSVEDVVHSLDTFNPQEVNEPSLSQHSLQVQPYPSALDESMIASLTAQQDLPTQTDLSRVEYFAVPTNSAQVPMHALYPYEHYLAAAGMPSKDQSGAIYQAGFQAGINLMQQQLACPTASNSETLTTTSVVPAAVGVIAGPSAQQFIAAPQQTTPIPIQPPCSHTGNAPVPAAHHCQISCSQHQQIPQTHLQQTATQVQAATQTANVNTDVKKQPKPNPSESIKVKKGRLIRHQNQNQPGNNFQQNPSFQIDPNSAITQYNTGVNQQCNNTVTPPGMNVDSETESNHDTALTLACAGGHEELVELLLTRGADIEHRDKKGFTPLILAATAGHEKVVEILVNHNADIEAQSERTKDTPLSLACSGGRYEVVEMLLTRNANKEHRNVSDYTPLSLAASGGYVNIIKLLLHHGAEINSRTGSKLGISPLMLAAMNGHTAAVKLLLDMGSDINAQIETNRNTALTLACFQGRHEVVSLLLDRRANVEHRAKTGLTPLMEAASGGYVEVGRVLLDKGADVNATPVPSSRDTALTIAADKGHGRFVELLLCRGAQVEVKNKKGNSPLWLAANGGHLSVVELLYNINADIDSQDNRKVSCLMAAFRKGHVKVVKWMVHHVAQFPSDQEMIRYVCTVSDKELLDKCQECVKLIRAAKETQAAKANKNASILLEELDKEKTREESKRLAAARRRERKKKKKLEKKEERRKLFEENKKNENYDEKDKKVLTDDDKQDEEVLENVVEATADSSIRNVETGDKEEGDSGIDANSQGSCSSNDIKSKEKRKEKKKKKSASVSKSNCSVSTKASSSKSQEVYDSPSKKHSDKTSKTHFSSARKSLVFEASKSPADRDDFEATGNEIYVPIKNKKSNSYESETVNNIILKHPTTSPKQSAKREEGWKEVVRKSSVQTVSTTEPGIKKVSVPLNAISRVIGRGGSNINAIRGATGAHIEVEKQCKGQGERIITIKGSSDATKQAHSLIAALIKDPEVDILQMLPKTTKVIPSVTTLWDKTQIGTKKVTGKVQSTVVPSSAAVVSVQHKFMSTASLTVVSSTRPTTSLFKTRASTTVITSRTTAPRLLAQAEKNSTAQNAIRLALQQVSSAVPSRPTTKIITTSANQTFAAKLTETNFNNPLSVSISQSGPSTKSRTVLGPPPLNVAPVSPQALPISSGNTQTSPKHNRPAPTASAPPTMQHYQSPGKASLFAPPTSQINSTVLSTEVACSSANRGRSTTPNIMQSTSMQCHEELNSSMPGHSEYSLFNSAEQTVWRREHESQKPANFAAVTGGNSNVQAAQQPKFIDQEPPLQVDASKAPGYRGGTVCSPVSSKTSSSSTTPPNITTGYPPYHEQQKPQLMPHISSNIMNRQQVSQSNPNELSNSKYYNDMFKSGPPTASIPLNNVLSISKDNNMHLMSSYHQGQSNPMRNVNYSQSQQSTMPVVSTSRLNPKAPDFSSSVYNNISNKPQLFNGYPIANTNPIYSMTKGTVDTYHRNNVSQPPVMPLMQFQQPFTQQQSEMISGMATGLTLHNLARATGGDILENGAELGIITNSPNMSPNLPPTHTMHSNENHYSLDDMKSQHPPIGSGRKCFNQPVEPNWFGNEIKSTRWFGYSLVDKFAVNRGDRGYEEPTNIMDNSQHGIQLDSMHNFSNGPSVPPYFIQPIGSVRSIDHVPVGWDGNTRQNIIEDKQHVWATMSDWKQ